MIRWKSLLGLCISFSLFNSLTAYAVVTVPSIPVDGITDQGGAVTGDPSSGNGQSGTGPGGNSTPAASTSDNVTTASLPVVKAEGAALYNVTSKTMLYTKNPDTRYYPASITKLMTALLVLENANLDDTVTFSAEAVKKTESGSVTLNLVAGDKMTVRQCLYALLLKSANEVGNGLAEHVSGSVGAFTDKMNARAKALGCTNTNFVNTNGLNHTNHYTTPGDMALIAAEAFKNADLCRIASTLSYELPAMKSSGPRTISMGHKMLYPNDARYYPGIVGGKTGYTSLAGNTLVTCVEKDGVRLIAVVLKSKQTHYEDTKAMLDFGFAGGGSSSSTGRWEKDGDAWFFYKPDGAKAQNQWMKIDGVDYWFDSNLYMAVGWRQFTNGAWYYFKPSGAMAKNYWVKTNEQWFYLGSDGVMLTNTTTPDGYWVNEHGVWKQ